MMQGARSRSHRLAIACVALLATLSCSLAGLARSEPSARQYVAGHGFAEPVRLGTSASTTRVALALEEGAPYAYWYDTTGVSRAPLVGDGSAQRLAEQRGTRDLAAVTIDGEPAVGQVVRNFETGLHEHTVAWRGASRTLASSLQIHTVALGAGDDGPIWALREPSDAGSALAFGGWNRERIVLRESDESISGYDVAAGHDGAAWVSWLEGSTAQTALGAFSNWRAYLVQIDRDGVAGEPIDLGPAAHRGRMDITHVSTAVNGAPRVLWPRDDGRLIATTFSAAPAADAAARADHELGNGLAIGVFEGHAYWADGDRILRMPLEPGGASQAVLWAPNAIESAASELAPSGDLFLTWYGGTLGGGFAVYGAGTHRAFEPGWEDRLAAAMGWNPWDLWSEALGQVLTSLLIGTLATMALAPLLWLAAALLVRFSPFEAWSLMGIAVSVAVILGTWGVLHGAAALPPADAMALFGTLSQIGLALIVGASVTWLLRRRADTEPLLGTIVAAASCSGIAIAILSFITFQAWSQSWQGIL